MAAITIPGMFLTGNHASRPSSGVGKGTIYACSTHTKLYQTTDTGATWVDWFTAAASGGSVGTTTNSVCQGRLTLTTGVPVTTSDVTAGTTLYFTPYKGNQIGTYSGSAWTLSTFTEKSITLVGLTADKNYDVFIVDSTLALELLVWTNDTTRATAITLQDGVYVKSGATTRRYLGTIRIIAAGGACTDSVVLRNVWNYDNRVTRLLHVFDSTDTWSYGTATWRAANNTATNHQLAYVCGVSEDPVQAENTCQFDGSGGSNAGSIGIGLDSTSANSAQVFTEYLGTGSSYRYQARSRYRGWPGIGYHTLTWLEYTRVGTVNYSGDGGVADMQSGILAEVLG